jgi:hypothetical protein
MDGNVTLKILAALINTALLSACACDAGDADYNVDTRTFKTDTPVAEPEARLIALSGLYDTSKDDDERYFYIDETGMGTDINYEGDAFGSGLNCYSIVNKDSNIAYDGTNQDFTMTSTAETVSFSFDSVNAMIVFNDGTSITASLNISIEDIESMLCAADV